MDELISLILIALICLVTGFLFGYLVSSLRIEKGNSRAAGESREPGNQDSQGGLQKAAVQPLASHHSDPAPLEPSGLHVHAEKERHSLNTVSLLARSLQPEPHSRTAEPKSIAAQIDEILQEKVLTCSLDGIPSERRAIRLIELPAKGMVVMVGLDQYEGVDKVPDPAIRSLIGEAVEEWEKQHAAG